MACPLFCSVRADIILHDEVFCDEGIFCPETIDALLNLALFKTGKKLGGCGLVTVVLMRDSAIEMYNAQHRQKQSATNVLAFPTVEKHDSWLILPQQPILLGDIFISLETLRREAHEQGKALRDHAMHLLLHGFLHLLHYDHIEDEEAEEMEGLERAIFQAQGWADPYGHGVR